VYDQQCYPIIELYDYLNICDDISEVSGYFTKLDKISDLLLSVKGSDAMLFETEENPADDPVLYPYHFSTQVLAWKTFKILNILNAKYKFSQKDYALIATGIKKDIFEFMITKHNGRRLFCYTTDLKGNFELYHDANDLPLGLAPLWDFIDAEDEVFQNTVEWAFSSKNRGYYDGNFGGLGSDHAKGHWPLGDSQLQAIALSMIKNEQSKGKILWKNTLDMLESTVQKDGLFSESVYPDSGEVYTRYWFAWPGAAISWLYLLNDIRG
jgi:uncharacterized protein